jgi:hypothetical protein
VSDDHLEALDPELDALLEAERAAVPPAASLDRVWSRVALVAMPSSVAGRASVAHPVTSTGWLASHAAGVATATFVLGGLAGAGIHAAIQKAPEARVVYVDRPAPLSSVPSYPVVVAGPAPSVAPAVDPSSAPRPSARSPAPPTTATLAAERSLLDEARSALASGDAAKAIALTDDHGRRFPRAQLGEEREAIAIQALVALGRNAEARSRAARFRSVAPNSLFMPAIDAALHSVPPGDNAGE